MIDYSKLTELEQKRNAVFFSRSNRLTGRFFNALVGTVFMVGLVYSYYLFREENTIMVSIIHTFLVAFFASTTALLIVNIWVFQDRYSSVSGLISSLHRLGVPKEVIAASFNSR